MLVTTDLIGLSAPIAEPVCARLAGQGQLQDRLVEVVLEALKKREPLLPTRWQRSKRH